jgi:hypothetical protein
MISKYFRKILNMKGPISREEQAIVKVLYSDERGPYEESPEEQDKMEEIERQCDAYDLAEHLGIVHDKKYWAGFYRVPEDRISIREEDGSVISIKVRK